MKSPVIFINLLNFRSAELAGAGVFAKRLLQNWLRTSHSVNHFVILQSDTISLSDTFGFPETWYTRSIKKNFPGLISRILFEQLILPFYLRNVTLYFSPTPVLPILTSLFGKTKLVITIHDMIPFFVPKKYSFTRSIYVKWISKVGARRADHVITVSESSTNDIASLASVDRKKISVVYNSIDVKNLKVNTGPSDLENLVVCIATVEPGKNIEHTLKAFRIFLNEYDSSYKLIWMGGLGWGYSWDEVNALINDLDMDGHVKFLGFVSEDQKTDFLKRCKVTIYLSHYEGFGLPLLESMQYGKPVLASSVSSLPEVLGDAGILCDPLDDQQIAKGLNELINNREFYAGRIPEQLKRFNEEDQFQKFLKVIDEQIG